VDYKYSGTVASQVYVSLWSKYRPVLIKLMTAAETEPQSYKLFDHEFKSRNPKERTYSFELQAYQGKAVNNIKTSAPAQDLLAVLNMSKTAIELMSAGTYQFNLDKHFMLKVVKTVMEPQPQA